MTMMTATTKSNNSAVALHEGSCCLRFQLRGLRGLRTRAVGEILAVVVVVVAAV